MHVQKISHERSVSHNDIDDDGVLHLVHTYETRRPTIGLCLNLTSNKISSFGATQLAQRVRVTENITGLRLKGNQIDSYSSDLKNLRIYLHQNQMRVKQRGKKV